LQSNQQQNVPTVRVAAQDEAAAISALAVRSKAHWGYSDDFMQACRGELTYSEAQIGSTSFDFRICEVAGRIAGFYALEFLKPEEAELEALFVEPELVGRGFGRMLIEHAKKNATASGIRQLVIQGDPNATDFYEAAGGVRAGQRESGSIPGRYLPLFRIDLNSPERSEN
jgi:N-acetylglutamate synthase-like GNAT family acetyltransferase